MENEQLIAASGRTPAQLRQHFEVETRLADRLRVATKEERRTLYTTTYEELYRLVPDHPQLTRKRVTHQMEEVVAPQLRLLASHLDADAVFLEVGAGDCALARRVAAMVRHVYAVDVSPTITGGGDPPRNLEVVISDGSNIPLPDASVDIAYSHQLIEHMHPDDALAHLREVSRVLKPGGKYICVTPSRWTGPHDISKFFRSVARGLHLREYSATDLLGIFQWLGWTRVTAEMCVKGVYFEVPASVAVIAEMCFAALPEKFRRRVAHVSVLNGMLGVVMIGRKPTRDEAEGL